MTNIFAVNDPLAAEPTVSPYVDLAVRTAAPFENPRMHILHAMLGMSNELLEIYEGFELQTQDPEYFIKEFGDFFWFYALYTHARAGGSSEDASRNFYDRVSAALSPQRLTEKDFVFSSVANKFVSLVKKEIFYSKVQTDEVTDAAVANGLKAVCTLISGLRANREIEDDIVSILTKNIAKLSERFEKGHFEQDAAINRDEAAEDVAVKAVS